jgi:hypothetical protein
VISDQGSGVRGQWSVFSGTECSALTTPPPPARPHVQWDGTRYKAWPRVAEFVASQRKGSLICDSGCGNGKNLKAMAGDPGT